MAIEGARPVFGRIIASAPNDKSALNDKQAWALAFAIVEQKKTGKFLDDLCSHPEKLTNTAVGEVIDEVRGTKRGG
jgi:hypothetical protein